MPGVCAYRKELRCRMLVARTCCCTFTATEGKSLRTFAAVNVVTTPHLIDTAMREVPVVSGRSGTTSLDCAA